MNKRQAQAQAQLEMDVDRDQLIRQIQTHRETLDDLRIEREEKSGGETPRKEMQQLNELISVEERIIDVHENTVRQYDDLVDRLMRQ